MSPSRSRSAGGQPRWQWLATKLSATFPAPSPSVGAWASRPTPPRYGLDRVLDQTALGALYVGPVPTASPPTSTVNFPLNDVRSNGITVELGVAGYVSATYIAAAGNTTI